MGDRTIRLRVPNCERVSRANPEALERLEEDLVQASIFPVRIDYASYLFVLRIENADLETQDVLNILAKHGFQAVSVDQQGTSSQKAEA